jgi:MFS family permease
MALSARSTRLRAVYDEYPPQFWMLILGIFIDRLGGALVFPFLTLYITKKFGIGMTELGLLIGLFSITNLVGSTLGGASADRLGRKGTLIFGLVVSALISLIMGYAESVLVLSASLLIVGLFANVGGPAAQAMVADLLPEEKRAEGFGILRVVANLAVAIGPAIGGVLAVRSYLILFVADAVTSVITAIFALAVLHETKPVVPSSAQHETMLGTLRGYRLVLQDVSFVAFLVASMLVAIVAMHLNTSLPVYLRDVHGVSEQRCGYVLTLNASMVVLFQFWLTRQVQAFSPLLLAAAGSALYGLGYAVYGFVSGYVLFLAAMVVVTTGEMVFVPAAQALAAKMARDDMRGRYLAAYGLSWGVPGIVAPLLAGLIMDNLDPRVLWYVSGLIGLTAAGGFVLMYRRVRSLSATSHSPRTQPAVARPAPAQSSGEVGCSPPA